VANNVQETYYMADVAPHGWCFASAFLDSRISAMTTHVKYYHYGMGRVLGAADLLATQGFDPAKVDISGFSYWQLSKLIGFEQT
jgi:hypothetical protein